MGYTPSRRGKKSEMGNPLETERMVGGPDHIATYDRKCIGKRASQTPGSADGGRTGGIEARNKTAARGTNRVEVS